MNPHNAAQPVFILGATGFIGRALTGLLLERGYWVHALARPDSAGRLPDGCVPVIGDALAARSFAAQIPAGATLVHLIGTPHPAPWKARQFQSVDLASVDALLQAARIAHAAHIVYLSVAQPAPVMRAYIAARQAAESRIRASGIPATFLRPWYVLGPGRRWPLLLSPLFWLLQCIPALRPHCARFGPLSLAQVCATIVHAVEHPPAGIAIMDVEKMQEYT